MSQVRIGEVTVGSSQPLALIGGPCVLEGRDLVLRTAERAREITSKLGIPYVFKASFDKANRSSISSPRGPGLDAGLELLAEVRGQLDIPVCTDFHEPAQAAVVADVADLLQIPAFLCRQTDMLLAAARTGRPTAVKKGQFLSPWDMRHVVEKLTSVGHRQLLVVERGASFGYGNLVLDLRSLAVLRELGFPVVLDATHCAQQPGAADGATGGQREYVPALVRGGVAVGTDALFMEIHPDPEHAPSDAATMWPLDRLPALLEDALRIDEASGRRG